ncbi:MAG: hypothetical protein Q620_VSAC01165G0001, partial [Veillonella sp. DORA_A_3_16_22]
KGSILSQNESIEPLSLLLIIGSKTFMDKAYNEA